MAEEVFQDAVDEVLAQNAGDIELGQNIGGQNDQVMAVNNQEGQNIGGVQNAQVMAVNNQEPNDDEPYTEWRPFLKIFNIRLPHEEPTYKEVSWWAISLACFVGLYVVYYVHDQNLHKRNNIHPSPIPTKKKLELNFPWVTATLIQALILFVFVIYRPDLNCNHPKVLKFIVYLAEFVGMWSTYVINSIYEDNSRLMCWFFVLLSTYSLAATKLMFPKVDFWFTILFAQVAIDKSLEADGNYPRWFAALIALVCALICATVALIKENGFEWLKKKVFFKHWYQNAWRTGYQAPPGNENPQHGHEQPGP